MKKSIVILVAIFMATGLFSKTTAQGTNTCSDVITFRIDAIRILGVTGVGISLGSNEAVDVITGETNGLSYLNYTSIIEAGKSNKIIVILANPLPALTTLKVIASAYSGIGSGTFGVPTSELTLSTTEPQDIITGIGSCWTGVGSGNGHKLTYVWSTNEDNHKHFVSSNPPFGITVIYKIVGEQERNGMPTAVF